MTTLENSRIVVTGGTGFIGSHLVRRLINSGAYVAVLEKHTSQKNRISDLLKYIDFIDVDIRNSGDVSVAMQNAKPDVVFHLAAEGVTDPFFPHIKALNTNVEGTINVVKAAASANAQRIINTGTSYEYGDKSDSRQLDPISPYAASKAAAWAFCKMYHRTAGWPIVMLRLFQVYGPGQIDTLIPSAIKAASNGQSFPTTSGEQIRDWIYIDDVVDAYLKVATTPDIEGMTLDIGTGIGHSVREVIERIFSNFKDAQPLIGSLPQRPGEIQSLIAHADRTKQLLHWEPEVELTEGIQQTVASYIAQSEQTAQDNYELPTDPLVEQKEQLRKEILDRVQQYYRLVHEPNNWQPGKKRVQYAGRVFDEKEMWNMTDSVLDFWLTAGRFSEEFEQKLGSYLGVREVIPVNSGSSANLVAMTTLCSNRLRGYSLQPGDEVITTAIAFPTTLAPIVQNGLVPVLVDSQPGNYNIDIQQLAAALSPKTRALFVTHTLGNPVEMDAILDFAREHDLYVIEDNCDALGSKYAGKLTGTFGDLATSSFYPAHHITMGEGGAVYTNSPHMAKIARTIRDWGRDCWCGYINPPDGRCGKRFSWEIDDFEGYYDHRYLFTEIGYNLKLTDPQAAIGVAQLDKLPDFVIARQQNFNILYEALKALDEFFELPTWGPKADPSWFAFPLTVRNSAPFGRNTIQQFLESHMIETRLLFAGNILKHPGYKNINYRTIGKLPVANETMKNTFFIGLYPGLKRAQLEYIVEIFYDFINNPDTTA